MCGIAGLLQHPDDSRGAATLESLARRMSGALAHRGPDADGAWVDVASGIAVAHRRLSIVDLSPEGHQPMTSASGRYVIVYNGEIYNHAELRSRLDAEGDAPAWRGHSDTEVMLAVIERDGVDEALHAFNGMFAFALWDRRERTLHLARDRLGEKPLYFGAVEGAFAFASELKAFRALGRFEGRVDPTAVALFLRLGYIPAPHSIYRGISKLEPGTHAKVRAVSARRFDVDRQRYWDLGRVARNGLLHPFAGDEREALDELERHLDRSVGMRMVADVPLGAFLSGGIDSSLVVATMQRRSSSPVRTFSIGFDNPEFDEAPFARQIAAHLGTEHTEQYVTGNRALEVVPALPTIHDEPFADASQIPTYLVSRVARRDVTVSLSGDGGDELFAGYERYVRTLAVTRLPAAIRRGAGAAMRRISPARLGLAANVLLPSGQRFAHASDKLAKLAAVLDTRDDRALYEGLVTQWRGESVPALNDADVAGAGLLARRDEDVRFDAWMMLVDQQTYLPDDILAKVDRAAMAVGLETRVPLLDHELVAFAWSLPLALKVRGGRGKWLLRRLLQRYVPVALFDRPKRGFAVPLAEWLRGPLRDWAEHLLDERRLREQGWLDASRIGKRWRDHLDGTRNAQDELWTVLSFQSWLEHEG